MHLLHMLNECDIRFQTSVEERIAALRIFGLWLVLIFCEKRITAYSEKISSFKFARTIVCYLPISAQKTKMMLTIMNISMAVSPSALIESDYNCEKTRDVKTLGMLLVILLKMLTNTNRNTNKKIDTNTDKNTNS